MIPIPLERKLINITSYDNLSDVHIWRGSFKQEHDYCICTEYKSLLVFTRILVISQHRTSSFIEMQGIQHDSDVPSDKVTSDFQRFHTNSMVSLPSELEIDRQQSLKRVISLSVWLWRRLGLISRPGSWLLYMSIVIYYAQEHGDTLSPPNIYFIMNKE